MISSIQYLPCRTVSTDLSASAVSTSSTSSLLTEPPAQTAVAASSVAPPEKPEKRRHSACSASSSRSQLQSTTARSVWCLGSAAAAGQQPEAVIEPGRDLLRIHRPDPRRGQFDGQRHPVQRQADPLGGGCRFRGESEAGAHRAGPLLEQ